MQSCVPQMAWRMAHATEYLASLLFEYSFIARSCWLNSVEGLPTVWVIGPLCEHTGLVELAVLARVVAPAQQAVAACEDFCTTEAR